MMMIKQSVFLSLRAERIMALLGSALGGSSILLPWWSLTWTWEGGIFVQTLFLYGNRVDGQLPGLGVSGPIEVNIAAYDFASFALAIVFLAFVTGVYSGFGGASRRRPLRILSAALFLSAWLVFIAGLSFALSEEGRSIFTSETLASSGSHVGSGFALGFYLAFAAVALLGLSHMIERSRVKRKGG